MKQWYLKVVILGVIAVGAGLLCVFAFSSSAIYAREARWHADSFNSLSTFFADLAKKKGAVFAFDVLRRVQFDKNVDMHLLGHVVGGELYKQQGVSGITSCTQDFRNACSHALVIGAYTEFGEAAFDMIRDTCSHAPGGLGAYLMCYHGLGHGIFAYYDYDLKETVAHCKKTGTREHNFREYTECVGGAIMELSSSSGHDPEGWVRAREKYLTAPLEPCMSPVIPEDAKVQCIMYITPEIWRSVGIDLARPDPNLFSSAFAVCDRIDAKYNSLRKTCFASFGKEFPVIVLHRDVRIIKYVDPASLQVMIDWCGKAPHVFGENACIEELVDSIFWGGENDPDVSFKLCAQVSKRNESACYGSLARNISRYMSDVKTKKRLCDRIPDAVKDICSP